MAIKPIADKYCRFLKARSPYGLTEGGDNPWYLLDESNTICWCVKSVNGVGPDNGMVTPNKCVEGRGCFVPPSS